MRASFLSLLATPLFLGAGLASAAVNLSGTVFDKDNKPLPGVVVSLAKGGLSDTTGSDGKWALVGSATGIVRANRPAGARWNGKTLDLTLPAPATVQVESYDARGARLGLLAQARLEAGTHGIPVGSARAATGMRWLRLSVDGKTQVIATGSGTRLDQPLPASLARSAEDSVDQLVYVLQGQRITADTVRSLIQSGLEKWVQEFSVSGKVTADPRVAVDSVYAWFDGGRMSGMRRGRLGFNKANSAYSGRIYTVKSLTGDVYDYRVWLNVLGNGSKRTGISDTTDFSSEFGAIDFIPAFSVANALPTGSIAGPATGLVNTALSFKLALDRKDEQLAHIEWDLADGKGFATGKDTVTSLWLQPGSYGLQARLTDIDSNVILLTRTVNISNQAAVTAGLRDTSITPSDVVLFSMTAHDTDGVVKVLWNFGDGTTDSTFTGETHTVSHKYPGTDAVPAGTSKVYELTATVVDKLGNSTPQVARITVTNDVPTVSVHDTVGETGTTLTLHALAQYKGTLAKVEWSVNGGAFAAGGKDTTIQLPTSATMNYPVAVRVTDEDGNLSATDTAKIIVGDMMTDARDGQKYRIVTIGTQTWMAQNLNYKVDSSWWYNNSPDSGAKYGRLYQWASAMGLNDSCNTKSCTNLVEPQHRGVCPAGWHIPSDTEWNDLQISTGLLGNTDGTKLKAKTGWEFPRFFTPDSLIFGNGTDEFGFSAYPSGSRYPNGSFGYGLDSDHINCYWWGATQENIDHAFLRRINFDMSSWISNKKIIGFSIRCIKD